ncbi:TIGR04283 family arsenosugar biosynthesis glycosyltransferase [Hyphomicrobium sp.]|uniref:TIGR04283 family arsenosugar biosynthesis glycosyltransferase n=1 Tax=Hyphomicrobium sp. TaxID=82 RepID=UPI0025BC6DD9|nr:TIGR04283 family arsenosugar biosynthesis glycosyltransferase [Hyphomicrobium sp.]MCC7253227.1 TIGR04283 family arsenosugar biosynthesis glycosyltransferase [Hyphomicrobium sp.]
MISVVIPTFNAEAHLAETLTSLVPAAVDGLVREVIVADGGSTDRTLEIADGAGAEIVKCAAGRGAQLKAGAARARFPWLLFLNADTYLDIGWEREVNLHIERVEGGRRRVSAASFRFTLDDEGLMPRTLETLVSLRTGLLKLPYGDQGLLISRALYDEVGGFDPLPLMEDVDIARRLGRSRLAVLNARVMTRGEHYRREGYLSRVARSQACLGLYLIGVPVRTIATLLGRSPEPVGEPAVGRSLP